MKQLILCLMGVTLLLTGCSEESVDKKVPARLGSVIELVTFRLSENPTKENKGFGPGYYCYINLETDSVYIQRKVDSLDESKTIARAGYITGISKHPAILAYIDAGKQHESGKLITPKTPEGALYCGPNFYTNYRQAGKERIHYFTSRGLDKRFALFTDYIFTLIDSKELVPVSRSVSEDSVIIPIVTHQSFGLSPAPPWSDLPPPPPPVRSKLNFTPPLEKP